MARMGHMTYCPSSSSFRFRLGWAQMPFFFLSFLFSFPMGWVAFHLLKLELGLELGLSGTRPSRARVLFTLLLPLASTATIILNLLAQPSTLPHFAHCLLPLCCWNSMPKTRDLHLCWSPSFELLLPLKVGASFKA